MSFGEVGRAILGPRGKTLIDVFLVGTQLGICCVYFTFVATNIHTVLPAEYAAVDAAFCANVKVTNCQLLSN